MRVERSGRKTTHLFWPFFSWTSAPDGGGWRAWPVVGHSWIEESYDRWWALWPVFSHNEENLKSGGAHGRRVGALVENSIPASHVGRISVSCNLRTRTAPKGTDESSHG